MSLTSGTKIGPYEILSLLGAGGMGEVYRGRDSRLGRDVAIKILPASFSVDPNRLRRFEQEARAAGQLNHPNILAIYDIGTHEGSPYLVSELLEGETLRSQLSEGALPQRKVIDYGIQISHGLSAAHEKEIVHRDLKPENLFVTKDDRVKILDFGLAKLLRTENSSSQRSKLETIQPQTDSGVVLGTVGYMSPEQVRGKPADLRSDIFAFGAVLYEMLTGIRPFRGDSAVETMNAILKEEPPDITATIPAVSPILDHVVRRCLEKKPDLRFRSASDLGFALKELSILTSPSTSATKPLREKSRWIPWVLAALMAIVAIAALIFGWKTASVAPSPQNITHIPAFQRLTFRRGNVLHARFAPDGKTVVYGAAWEGNPTELFVTSPGSPESRPLGITKADVLSVNLQGEMAILRRSRILQSTSGTGTLAIAALTGGGAPREILEDVYDADWLPDNRNLAVFRSINGKNQLEFPIGNVVFQSNDDMSSPRVSPDGNRVLFVRFAQNFGSIVIINRKGQQTVIKDGIKNLDIAGWTNHGTSITFPGELNDRYGIYSTDLKGNLVAFIPWISQDHWLVHDISSDGTLLLEQELNQRGIRVLLSGEKKEREVSWLDGSFLNDISNDGRQVLISEEYGGGGPNGSIYLRNTDGSQAIKLGTGYASDLSDDGRWVVGFTSAQTSVLSIIPTGAGNPREVSPKDWNCVGAKFSSDTQFLFLGCAEPNKGQAIFKMDLKTLKIQSAFSPQGSLETIVGSPNGKYFLARVNGKFGVYPHDGNAFPFVSTLGNEDQNILLWNQQAIYSTNGDYPPTIFRIDAITGKREVWKQIVPEDPTIIRIDSVAMTPDARSFAYEYVRVLSSDLYLMTPPRN